jgi:Flp pilus assembly protein TadD
MMKRMAWKFAASTLVLAAVSAGSVTYGTGAASASASQADPGAGTRAAQAFQRAGRAIAENKIAEAVGLLEQAVALSPHDAGYRLMLADAYMKSGRFQSAEQSYREVLEIDRGRTRAALGLALMQLANGRQQQALAELEQLEGNASPADLGLAYALAGAPQRAIDLLEPAARSMGATPRVRQNLALAYALGGDWQRARTIAAQDVAPGDLTNRMTQWAELAQRSGSPSQVASLLGVSPVQDAGRPVRLALNAQPPAVIAAPQPVEYAEAAPVIEPAVSEEAAVEQPASVVQAPAPVVVALAEAAPAPVIMPAETVDAPAAAPVAPQPVIEAPRPMPVAYAEAAPAPVIDPSPVPAPAPTVVAAAPAVDDAELETPEWGLDESGSVELPKEEPAEERVPVRVQYAAAAESLVRPDPVVMPVRSRAARALKARSVAFGALPGTRSADGKFVVQIGAFSSAENADRAWQTYQEQFGLGAEQPVTMTIDHRGRLLHRVAISGFERRGDASQVCKVIQARGGACFVRSNAGDASINWAARYTRNG